MYTESTRLVDMTLGDLMALLDERDRRRAAAKSAAETLPQLVYGLDGIRTLYHCSKPTALRIKRSGRLDGAITEISERKFAVDVRKALELMPLKQREQEPNANYQQIINPLNHKQL